MAIAFLTCFYPPFVCWLALKPSDTNRRSKFVLELKYVSVRSGLLLADRPYCAFTLIES